MLNVLETYEGNVPTEPVKLKRDIKQTNDTRLFADTHNELYFYIKAHLKLIKPVPKHHWIHMVAVLVLFLLQGVMVDLQIRPTAITFIQFTFYILFRLFLYVLFINEVFTGIHGYQNIKIGLLTMASSSWLVCLYGDRHRLRGYTSHGTYTCNQLDWKAGTAHTIIIDFMWILVFI